MGLLKRILERSNRREVWKVPFEGSTTPPGYRPEGWEFPPKGAGDSDILVTRGEADGSHITARAPESQSRGRENKG